MEQINTFESSLGLNHAGWKERLSLETRLWHATQAIERSKNEGNKTLKVSLEAEISSQEQSSTEEDFEDVGVDEQKAALAVDEENEEGGWVVLES